MILHFKNMTLDVLILWPKSFQPPFVVGLRGFLKDNVLDVQSISEIPVPLMFFKCLAFSEAKVQVIDIT